MHQHLRILLVDDHETVRHGLKLVLQREPDLDVVGDVGGGDEAIECARSEPLDVIVMDVSMPGMSGLVATRRLKEMQPSVAIVSLTRHADRASLQESLRAGTSGYVLKQSSHLELLRAIRAAANGQQYVDPALVHHLAAPFIAAQRKQVGTPGTISDRESQVLQLVAVGHSNKDIAARLTLSVKTIELHKANAMQKLGLHGRIALLRYARHHGWLDDV